LKKIFLLLSLVTATAFGQGVRFDSNVTTSASNVPAGAQAPVYTLPNAKITVCGYPATPATVSPCTNQVPIYTDQALTQVITQPLQADSQGRFGFWISPSLASYSVQTAGGAYVGTFALSLNSPPGPVGPPGSTTATGSTGAFTVPSTLTAGTYAYGPLTTVYLITDGDSITAGAGLPNPATQSWPAQLSQLPFFKNRATLVNAAVSGQGCAGMTSRYPTAVRPFKPNGSTITKSYLTVLIGRNDLAAAAPLEACIDAYVTQAKADGFTVTLMTILPSAITTAPYAGFTGVWDPINYAGEMVRQQVNDFIRRDTIADNVFDFAQVLANPYDANWTQDGTHPTVALDALIARNINTFFQQNSAIQNPQPQDGYNPIFHGFVQAGDGAGGDMISAANLSLQIIPGIAGVHTGWNFGGGQEGDFICVPISGNGVGCNIYATHSDGTTPALLGAFTPSGLTTQNVSANGPAGPGAMSAGLFVASIATTSPFYRGQTGQPAFAQGGAGSTFDFAVRNLANNTNLLLVDDATGNTAITGGFITFKAPPATATTPCTAGEMRDGVISAVAYHFFCYATNQWARVVITPGGW
jgi:lysophospholipase L1-like esterase